MAANKGKGTLRDRGGALVDGLARSVISRVSYDALQGRQARLDAGCQVLLDATLSHAPMNKAALRATLEELRISREDLVDHCIPRVARALGEDWLQDRMTFVTVTTASARLFGLCKEVTTDWNPWAFGGGSRHVLVGSIGNEHHILGSTILTEQLRRNGHSVRTLLNASTESVVSHLQRADFDAIFLSVATYRTLDLTAQAIKTLRGKGLGVPVFVGGPMLDLESELEDLTGADLVTNDLDTALAALAELPSHEMVEAG